MKSKTNTNNFASVPTYPRLKIYEKDKSFIVLFTTAGTGLVIWTDGVTSWSLGSYSVSWRENEFTDFNREVVLSND